MFSSPHVGSEGSPPVINLGNSTVLSNLLAVVYPVSQLHSLSDFSATAKKYEMAVPFHRLDQDFAS
jgi:hypothetical protein